MSRRKRNDLIEQTDDGEVHSIPAPFVAHTLKRFATTFFDNLQYSDCELRLADGHFLWANSFFLTYYSEYFDEVLDTKYDETQLHPALSIVTHNNRPIIVIDLPIDPLHRRLLRNLMFAVRNLLFA
jgi:hypothetical protein